ncbi:MAG TPA: DUF4166 domain-containing protein [Bryobacteraceae bacterium]
MLYPQLLAADFARLPRVLREFHSAPRGGKASGTAVVTRSNRWLAWLAGFPPSGENIPLQLEVQTNGNREIWIRQFGGVMLRTSQRQEGDLLLEARGPVRIFFRISADETGMRFKSQRARLWIIPLPFRVAATVRGNESSWEVDVTVGRIGSYQGALAPAP